MTVIELHKRLTQLMAAGHSEKSVYLDTNPQSLSYIADVDIDSDGDDVIIWGGSCDDVYT